MTERILTCPELVDKLTVEALVDCRRDGAEALQVLVSKWRPPDSFDRKRAACFFAVRRGKREDLEVAPRKDARIL